MSQERLGEYINTPEYSRHIRIINSIAERRNMLGEGDALIIRSFAKFLHKNYLEFQDMYPELPCNRSSLFGSFGDGLSNLAVNFLQDLISASDCVNKDEVLEMEKIGWGE